MVSRERRAGLDADQAKTVMVVRQPRINAEGVSVESLQLNSVSADRPISPGR